MPNALNEYLHTLPKLSAIVLYNHLQPKKKNWGALNNKCLNLTIVTLWQLEINMSREYKIETKI